MRFFPGRYGRQAKFGYFVLGANEWHGADDWPSEAARPLPAQRARRAVDGDAGAVGDGGLKECSRARRQHVDDV
jgi:hypothetical protein